jgi:hypothetical protein
MVVRWKILRTNEVAGYLMTIVGQVAQHTAELDEQLAAGVIAQRGILLAQRAEPTEDMRIAMQLRDFVQMGIVCVKISKKPANARAIVCDCVRPQSYGEDLDLGLEYLIETSP